jgi:hypothetical protein
VKRKIPPVALFAVIDGKKSFREHRAAYMFIKEFCRETTHFFSFSNNIAK